MSNEEFQAMMSQTPLFIPSGPDPVQRDMPGLFCLCGHYLHQHFKPGTRCVFRSCDCREFRPRTEIRCRDCGHQLHEHRRIPADSPFDRTGRCEKSDCRCLRHRRR